MKNIQDEIVKNAHHYAKNAPSQWSTAAGDKKTNDWCAFVYKHLVDTLIPYLNSNKEHFIEYTPAKFLWSTKSDISLGLKSPQKILGGVQGTGYIAVSDRNVYIFTYQHLTQQFPLYEHSVTNFILGALTREVNTTRYSEDAQFVIPNESIIASQIIQNQFSIEVIALISRIIPIEFRTLFGDVRQEFLTILDMARSGKLSEIFGEPIQNLSKPSTEIVTLIKKLADLYSAGILTEAEYENKKRELLDNI